MKSVVVGLGAMGKRRIRLLNRYVQKEISETKKLKEHIQNGIYYFILVLYQNEI